MNELPSERSHFPDHIDVDEAISDWLAMRVRLSSEMKALTDELPTLLSEQLTAQAYVDQVTRQIDQNGKRCVEIAETLKTLDHQLSRFE